MIYIVAIGSRKLAGASFTAISLPDEKCPKIPDFTVFQNCARTLLLMSRMSKSRPCPSRLVEWVEFCWLLATNPTFQAAPNKRKAYFEYRLAKIYTAHCP
jgi:hypothetical protein